MKKILLSVLCFVLLVFTAQAAGLQDKKIYIDPGHGSYGGNDRPMATIPFPNPASATGQSFYESNTNLWKCEKLEEMLIKAGAKTSMSHRECGGTTDGTKYNPALSARRQEATSWGADYFISVHSNASSSVTTNFLYLALSGHSGVAASLTTAQRKTATTAWPYIFESMGEGSHGYVFEPISHYSYTNMKIETQSLGVMRHSIKGFLSEGYFHTYQPSRHRALNKDWCRQEGLRYYRGIAAYYGQAAETKGYIMGAVKSAEEKMKQSETLTATSWYYRPGSHDQFKPLHGAVVTLYKAGQVMGTYKTDNYYNGVFVFEDLDPGTYTLDVQCAGYGNIESKYQTVVVKADKTVYPIVLMKKGTYVPGQTGGTAPTESLSLTLDYADQSIDALNGKTIKRVVPSKDGSHLYILAHDANKNPTLLVYNHTTNAIKETLATTGLVVTSAPATYKSLSDIDVTDDGYLVGIGEEYISSTSVKVNTYKWALGADGLATGNCTRWNNVTTQGGYSVPVIAGEAMAYYGNLADGYMYLTLQKKPTSGTEYIRWARIASNGTVVYSSSPGNTARNGDLFMETSPLFSKDEFIMNEANDKMHYNTGWQDNKTDVINEAELTFMPTAARHTPIFAHGKHYYMVAATNTGVQLVDITNGVYGSSIVTLTATALASNTTTNVAAAGASFDKNMIGLFVVRDGKISRYSVMVDVENNGGDTGENPGTTPEDPTEELPTGTITFSKLWSKTQAESGYLLTGDANRSIAYYNGFLYIPNVVYQKTSTFSVIAAANGSLKEIKEISANDFYNQNLRITEDGKMLLGNTGSAQSAAAKVTVYSSDLATGGRDSLHSDVLAARGDFFYPYGKWNESGYLLTLANDVKYTITTNNAGVKDTTYEDGVAVLKIPYSGGKLGTGVRIMNTSLPVVGYSAKAIPSVDGKSFYASAVGVTPTQHDISTGDFVDGFGDEKPTQVAGANTSGLAVFAIHGHTYMVTPLSRFGQFEIYDISLGLSKATKVKEVGTTKDLGNTPNGAALVDFATYVDGNDVYIYELAPNNGVAAYKFTFTPDGTSETPATPDMTYGSVKFYLQGGTLDVPKDNEALWDVMGREFDAAFPTAVNKSATYPNIANINSFIDAQHKAGIIANLDVWTAETGVWKWLGDYMLAHESDLPTTSSWSNITHWRFSTDGFFRAVVASTLHSTASYGKGDWTEAGKPEKWQPAYTFAHKPTKSGNIFLGWFDNAEGNGSVLTVLSESGDVYACWKSGIATDMDNIEPIQAISLRSTVDGVEMSFTGTHTIQIYHINGVLLESIVAKDYHSCSLPQGIYVICIDNHVYKFVR